MPSQSLCTTGSAQRDTEAGTTLTSRVFNSGCGSRPPHCSPVHHSTPDIAKWLAHKGRRRWHLHYTPTSSSWVNLIERWFKELTDKRLRRGVFTSVAELSAAITTWAEHWNTNPNPFIWKATAEDIIAKVQRGRQTLYQINSQTDR